MGIVDRLFGSPQDRFAREVLAAIRRALPAGAEIRYERDNFAIVFHRSTDDAGASIYLTNVYRECRQASRAERRDRITAIVNTFLTATTFVPDGWDEVRPMLRPVLRSALFGIGTPPAAHMLSRPALPHLAEYVVIDRPSSMAYVTDDHVRRWGVATEDVFATARENLASGTDIGGPDDMQGPAVLRFVDSGDAYFTSLLLLDGWLAGLADKIGGRPVAFVPDRASIVVAPDEPDLLAQLFQEAEEEYSNSPRSISPQAYTVGRDGRVVPYPALPGHVLAQSVQRADTILAAHEYEAQSDWLDRQHERDGIDIFVGRLHVLGRPDGSMFTVATWPEGVDSLLPRADYVAFAAAGTQPWFVSWPIVAEEVEDLVAEPNMAPARYRVTAWPGPEALERLQARATTP